MKDLKMLSYYMAKTLFDGVKDKGGKPYILHCTYVAADVWDRSESEEMEIAAMLHDVVEDTKVTIEVIELLFGEEIARLVDLVTRKEGESYMQFIDRVKTCPKATIIKKADIAHNMDLSRLETVTEADLARVKKYEKALKRLG